MSLERIAVQQGGAGLFLCLGTWRSSETTATPPRPNSRLWDSFLFHRPFPPRQIVAASPTCIFRALLSGRYRCPFTMHRMKDTKSLVCGCHMKLHHTFFSHPKRTKLNRVAKPTYGGDVYDAWGVLDGLISRAATVVKAGGLTWVGDSVLFAIFTFHPGHPEDTRWGLIPPHWRQIGPHIPQGEGSVVRGDEKRNRRAEDIVLCHFEGQFLLCFMVM
jgi:hypothetical protein